MVRSASKQGIRLYKCYFALQNACWESAPNPFVLHFSMQAARPGGTLFIR